MALIIAAHFYVMLERPLCCICCLQESADLQVFVEGRTYLNRAVTDDIVAVEILPRDQWSCPSSLLVEDAGERPAAVNDLYMVGHDRARFYPTATLDRLFFLILADHIFAM